MVKGIEAHYYFIFCFSFMNTPDKLKFYQFIGKSLKADREFSSTEPKSEDQDNIKNFFQMKKKKKN